jgi:ubiquinone biosynthesis protein Coq4
MTFWDKVKVVSIFVRVSLNPKRTDLIIEGIDVISRDPSHEALKEVEKRVLSNETFRAMYEQNYVPDTPSMDALKSCPEGSFGQAVFKHMDTNRLGFDLFPRYESQRPIKYLATRIFQDHDLWHALLGYDVSVEEEIALQGFAFAQYESPVSLMLIAGGLLNLLRKSPKRAIKAFNKIHEAYTIGKQAPFLLSVRLHDLFFKPLEEARQICGLAHRTLAI